MTRRAEVGDAAERQATRRRRCAAMVLVVALALGLGAAARAEDIGLYAPTAPFDGPVARLDFVSALATHLAVRTGLPIGGRAYAKSADFAAAIRRGEIQLAVVDAPYLAALGVPYTVLAVAERGGATQAAWEVVTSLPAAGILELRGKTVAVPDIGARNEAFVSQVLLEAEVPRDFFARITYSPDSLSALAAVEHGRAEVAIVPAGVARPAGVHRVATLEAVSWPLLVALPGAQGGDEVANAAGSFAGGAVFQRFTRGGDLVAATHELAGRFARGEHHAPLAVPPLHLAAAALLSGRKFQIARPEVTTYISGK